MEISKERGVIIRPIPRARKFQHMHFGQTIFLNFVQRVFLTVLFFFSTVGLVDLKAEKLPNIEYISNSNIMNDKKMDAWFGSLSSQEIQSNTSSFIKARNSENDTQQQYRNFYKENFLDFTPEEKARISESMRVLYPVLILSYPILADFHWRFVKIGDRVLNGMAHTLGDYIFLTPQVFAHYADSPTHEFEYVLIEETIHVFQRNHPDLFEPIYRSWGFQKAPKISGLESFSITHNPDCESCLWIYERENILIYPCLLNFKEEAFELEHDEQGFRVKSTEQGPVHQLLSSYSMYENQFIGTVSKYDPNETYANLFAQVVIFDLYKSFDRREKFSSDHLSLLYEPYRKIFMAHLKPKD